MKLRINERESSPSELAWNEFKNLISVSIPKRIEIIENKLQQNGQTIFSSEVIQEFNNIRTRLDGLQQQYQLTESMRRKGKVRLSESKLHNIIKESIRRVLKEGLDNSDNFGWVIGDYHMGLDVDHPFEVSEKRFKSKDEALNDGIEHLVKYKDYCDYGHTSGLMLFKYISNNGDSYSELLKEPIAVVEWDGIRTYRYDVNGNIAQELINL